jgi:hypothetical protein
VFIHPGIEPKSNIVEDWHRRGIMIIISSCSHVKLYIFQFMNFMSFGIGPSIDINEVLQFVESSIASQVLVFCIVFVDLKKK